MPNSGENAGKTLAENWVVRSFRHQKVALKRGGAEVAFDLSLEPGAKPERTRVVAFLQDEQTGSILATAQVPWGEAPISPPAAPADPDRSRGELPRRPARSGR